MSQILTTLEWLLNNAGMKLDKHSEHKVNVSNFMNVKNVLYKAPKQSFGRINARLMQRLWGQGCTERQTDRQTNRLKMMFWTKV